MPPTIIIGSGLAGYTLARELRKLDKDAPLTIITADDGRFYSKPMLSNALAAGKTADTLALNDAAQMRVQLNAEIRTHAQVDAINTEQHTISVNGETLGYGRLVLALGADTVQPALAGDAAAQALAVNDLADYARFRAAIGEAKRIVIMGGGLIGCEFANDLRSAGYHVEVIHPADYPLNSLVPEQAGRALQQALADSGVVWHLGKKAVAVDHAASGYRVTLSDDSVLEADAVLSAIGLRPRTALAQAAGIKTNRGIAVNRLLETSAADVYALGDCAEVEGLVLLYVMPLMQAARALAKTLTGSATPVTYPVMPVVVKTPACPVAIALPPPGIAGGWQAEQSEDGVCCVFQDDAGGLRGFALTGKATARKNELAKQLPPLLG